MNNENATTILINAKEILDDLGVHFWLTCGTLLGYYRENDFIGHDSDIDLGIFIKNHSPRIVEEFEKQGFTTVYIWGTLAEGLEYTFSKNNIKIDFFFFYEELDYIWSSAWVKQSTLIGSLDFQDSQWFKYIYPKTQFKKVIFKKHEFNTPDDIEKYLAYEYGKFWKIPQSEWSWYFSPKNIIDAPFLKVNETEIKVNYCLVSQLYVQALSGLIEEYKQNPSNQSILFALQEARKQQADFWLLLSPDQIKNTYSGMMGIAHRMLIDSGLNQEPTPEAEGRVLSDLKSLSTVDIEKPEFSQYLLVSLLYNNTDQLTSQPNNSISLWSDVNKYGRKINNLQKINQAIRNDNFGQLSYSLWELWVSQLIYLTMTLGRQILPLAVRDWLWNTFVCKIYHYLNK